jgi:hypothetical protein
MKARTLQTRIALDPKGKLTEIQMSGKVDGNGHELEINEY